MGRVHVGAKSRNCPIFSCKEELAWGELRVLTDDKVDRAVENIASGRRGFYAVGSRNSDRRRDLLAGARVMQGKACDIVWQPPWAVSGPRPAARADQRCHVTVGR